MREGFRLEDFFLRFFKAAVLLFMTLALLTTVGLVAGAAYEWSKKPQEPPPARKAEDKDVTLDDLKKELLKPESPAQAPAKSTSAPNQSQTLKYLEDVTLLYRCSTDFAKIVGVEIEEMDNALIAQRVEDLRSQVERLADAEPDRGSRWVKSAIKFTCDALKDSQIIAFRKEGKLKGVMIPTLNFHLKRWDRIAHEKAEFEKSEVDRVERARLEEAARIAAAKATAVLQLTIAGVAFGIFMALALYLILAKIEINLRDLNRTVSSFRSPESVRVQAEV
jgi:hypothetical protein